jgi:cell division protein FtsZ
MTTENSDYNFSLTETGCATRMVALGIGGMGSNAMENLARAEIGGLELFSLNTDRQALVHCRGSQPVQIGDKRTGGKGAGGNSDVGRLSAEDDAEIIRGIVKGAELVFIASGMGGGTGTGAAPVIAKICRELGIMCIGTVTMPLSCEGSKRNEKARAGLDELRRQVDSLLIIENENLLAVMGEEDVSIKEAFQLADNVLVKSVKAITSIIDAHGYINLDLADLRNVLQRGDDERGVDAFIGIGEANGEDRAVRAAELALRNPLLRQIDIMGAANLLINVAGSEEMGQREAMQAVKCVVDSAGDLDREIFMGVVTDNSLGDTISVTIIATGLPGGKGRIIPLARQDADHMIKNFAPENSLEQPVEEVTLAGLIEVPEPGHPLEIAETGAEEAPCASDGYGYSPLVCKADWQIPAYLRRRSIARTAEVAAPIPRLKKVIRRDCESESHLNNQAIERSLYRQPLYNLA